MPLFSYEMDLYNRLETEGTKYLWIKKATGLGISELFLRFIAWKCLKDDQWTGSRVLLFTGPRIELAITLVDRLKGLFPDETFETKNTVCLLNGCTIEAYPSHHVSTARGLVNIRFILIDEAAFFPIGQQEEIRTVAERYIAKSSPAIIWVSTPAGPDNVFESIGKEADLLSPADKPIYSKVYLSYKVGLGKIYTVEEIEEARKSPSFEREYNLKSSYGLGNVFTGDSMDNAISHDSYLQGEYISSLSPVNISMGIDPGWGSSKFAIVITSIDIDGQLHVLDVQEYDRAEYSYMTETCSKVVKKYEPFRVYIDAANPGFIKSMKMEFHEVQDYEAIVQSCKHDKISPGERMRFIPVNFRESGRQMLTHVQSILADGLVTIDPRFNSLIQQMRIARVSESSGQLDKKAGISTYDALDAFLLSAYAWRPQ